MKCRCDEKLEAERKYGMGVRIQCLEERLSKLEQPEKRSPVRFEDYILLSIGHIHRIQAKEATQAFIYWLEKQKIDYLSCGGHLCKPNKNECETCWNNMIIDRLIERAKK